MAKFKVYASSHGTPEQLIELVEDKIEELGGVVEMATDIDAGETCNCGEDTCPICNPDLDDIEECDIPTL